MDLALIRHNFGISLIIARAQIGNIFARCQSLESRKTHQHSFLQDIDTKFNSMMREPYFVKLSGEKQGLEGIHHFHFTVKTDAVNHQIFRNKVQR